MSQVREMYENFERKYTTGSRCVGCNFRIYCSYVFFPRIKCPCKECLVKAICNTHLECTIRIHWVYFEAEKEESKQKFTRRNDE